MTRTCVALVVALLAAGPAAAQSGPPTFVFLRGVPAGAPTGTPVPLSLADAIQRGLANNLGLLLEQQRVRTAEGSRWRSLGELLPHVSAGVRETDQIVNLAAFGFTGFPGIPQLIGPFTVLDARVAVSAPIVDLTATNDLRADNASLRAEQFAARNTRELVILVVANLYLQALADTSRVESVRSQVATAEALYQLAQDQKASGIVAGIDVLRQQVQLESARQRLIVAENTLDKRKLTIAHAIGLPPGQAFELTDQLPYAPAPPLTLEAATEQALAQRDDLKSAQARADAARAAHRAAEARAWPSLHFDADYGAVGSKLSDAARTFTVGASLRVPLFQGGDTHGRVLQADAELKQREAELADFRAGIQFEIAAALMDVKAAGAAVDVARSTEALARQQLDQAQDRFRAGVASTIELTQAQESLATASDNYIASLYAHNLAKAALARALGVVEARLTEFLGGRK